MDSYGLVVSERKDLNIRKIYYARDVGGLNFLEAIESIRPHVLIGATATGNVFTKEVIQKMSAINPRPVIFPLSNPSFRSECTAQQAYEWSNGQAVFASGSRFNPVEFNGHFFKPGQGNNAFVFPGVGLGATISKAKYLNDDVFLIAAKTIAANISEEDVIKGTLYPSLKDIRKVSCNIGLAVANKIYDSGLARAEKPEDLEKAILDYMYDPRY